MDPTSGAATDAGNKRDVSITKQGDNVHTSSVERKTQVVRKVAEDSDYQWAWVAGGSSPGTPKKYGTSKVAIDDAYHMAWV